MRNIIVAIDGFAGCGKSSTAKRVAEELGYLYLDSGAMYRAVALYFLRYNVSPDQSNENIKEVLDNIFIDFVFKPGKKIPQIALNGEIVDDYIRTPEVSAIVSPVSAYVSVRKELVAQQRRLGEHGGVVMDGRDIGTVVFPNAELKIFMTADLKERAIRRKKELSEKGIDVSLEEVMDNLKERDRIDSTRKISPIRQAKDAIILDTTNLTIEDQVKYVVNLAREIIVPGIKS